MQKFVETVGEEAISSDSAKQVIQHYCQRGFESLTLQDLAIAVSYMDFCNLFKSATGIDWISQYHVKAMQRLKAARYDIRWMTTQSREPNHPLFVNCIQGDVNQVKEYIKTTRDQGIKYAVDSAQQSPLHHAAGQGFLPIVQFLLFQAQKFLIKGFNSNARDRTLQTPLHYACMGGHQTIADALIRNGGDIQARDAMHRNCLHYASMSDSANLITLLVGMFPDLVHTGDNEGLTPLHYSIYNTTSRQVEIIRTLIEMHAQVNGPDVSGKTALHHAAKSGQIRAIPILVQRGGDITLKDNVMRKTPLEMALNERTRETIVVYASAPMGQVKGPNPSEVNWLNSAVQGETLVLQNSSLSMSQTFQSQMMNRGQTEDMNLQQSKMMMTMGSGGLNENLSQFDTARDTLSNSYPHISNWLRNQFFALMKQLQEQGIKAYHHVKKPYLYTGSWMEGIKNIEELHQLTKELSATEAMVRCFNILCPYEKDLPRSDGMGQILDSFYGMSWVDGGGHGAKQSRQQEEAQQDQLSAQQEREQFLQALLEKMQEEKNQVAEELKKLEKKRSEENKANQDEYQRYSQEREDFQLQLSRKEQIIKNFNNDTQKITDENMKMHDENERLKTELSKLNAKINSIVEEKTRAMDQEMRELKLKNSELQEKEKQNRLKAGILFQNVILKMQNNYLQQVHQDDITKLTQQDEDIQIQQFQPIPPPPDKPAPINDMEQNMGDDEAIVRLFLALKQSSPFISLPKRLEEADKDGDSYVTQTEFLGCMTKLSLSPNDITALQRVAGFSKEKVLLSIQDFLVTLEERPQLRQIWEQRLFKRMQDAIQKRQLSIDRFFQLIDVNNDQQVSPDELKSGMEGLRIILNQRDIINLYQIFDRNKDGTLNLDEVKQTLKYYSTLEKDSVDISFADRMGQDDFDDETGNVLPDSQKYNTTMNIFNDSRIPFSEECIPVSGDLKIQIPYCKEIERVVALGHVTVRVMLRGASQPEIKKTIIMFDPANWNFSVRIPIRNSLIENVYDFVHIQLFESEDKAVGKDAYLTDDLFLGEVRVMWKGALESPLQWFINHQFPLGNLTYKKQKTKPVKGSLGVQMKWIPSNSAQYKGKPVSFIDLTLPGRADFTTTIGEVGQLFVMVSRAFISDKNIAAKSSLIASIQMPLDSGYDKSLQGDEDQQKKNSLDASQNPFWGLQCSQKFEKMANIQFPAIFVQIEKDNGTFSKNDVLCQVPIDWEECIDWPGQFITKKVYPFQCNQNETVLSKLYVTVRWEPETAMMADKGKVELEKGKLKILVVRAKNLRADDGDTSDPYVKFIFQNYPRKFIEASTKVCKQTINPKFGQTLIMDVEFIQEPIPQLQAQIVDQDTLGDDQIGDVTIDLFQAIKKPCTWAINQIFPINDPKYTRTDAKPEIYLQIYYVPQGMTDPNLKPVDINGGSSMDDLTVAGNLIVRVVHARDVQKADNKASDPYAIVKFPDHQEKETKVISGTLNPIWNETFNQPVSLQKDRIPKLIISVQDSDTMASDDLLGSCEIDWQVCIAQAGQWGINTLYELQGPPDIQGSYASLGFIYIQIQFLEEGMADDGIPCQMIQNLADIISQRQGLYQGTLMIFLVHAFGLVKADDDTSDPFVVFKVPGGQKVESATVKKSVEPSWKQMYTIPVMMPKDSIQPMRVEVYDDDMMGDDLIGYCNITLDEVLKKPGEWVLNQNFKLDGDTTMRSQYQTDQFGQIYMQIQYVVDGATGQTIPQPLNEDIDEQKRKQFEIENTPMKGVIDLNIVMARGLLPADQNTSDPYCQILFPDQHKLKTQKFNETLNPAFNFQSKHNINILKKNYQDIVVTVYDSDKLGDDELGSVQIPWMLAYENPMIWKINELFQIQGKQQNGVDLGEIYIQCNFTKEEDIDKPEAKQICSTLRGEKHDDIFHDFGRILGKIEFTIISASNLPKMDLMGESDPFVEAYLSITPHNSIKTEVGKEPKNPVWNKEFSIPIDLLRIQVQTTDVVFEVQDDDGLSSDLFGTVNFHIIQVLEKWGQEIEQEYPILDPKKKDSKTTYGNLKIKAQFQKDDQCQSLEGLREPDPMVKGQLFVKIVNARGLKDSDLCSKSDPYVSFSLSHDTLKLYNTDKKENTNDPDFNFVPQEPIQINITETLSKTLRMRVVLKEDDGGGLLDKQRGGLSIDLNELIEIKGKWVNGFHQMRDEDGVLIQGFLYIQAQFRPEGDTSIDTKEPAIMTFEEYQNMNKPPTIPGQFYMIIPGAQGLKSGLMDKSDPFTEIRLSHGPKHIIKTKVIDDNQNPVWNHVEPPFDLELTQEEWPMLKMYVQLMDYDMASSDLLGQDEFSISGLVDTPGEWVSKELQLVDEKGFPGAGTLYVQFGWSAGEMKPPPENPIDMEKEKKRKLQQEKKQQQQEQAKEPVVQGKLIVKVLEGKDLLKIDTFGQSDPYVEIQVKGCKSAVRSKTIDDNNQNPAWNQELIVELEMQESEFKAGCYRAMAQVNDYGTTGDQFMGYYEWLIDPLFLDPNLWINQAVELKDNLGGKGQNGFMSIQIQWRPEINPPKPDFPAPASIQDLIDKIDKQNKEKIKTCLPKGIVVFGVVSAQDILCVEQQGTISDAKLKIYFNQTDDTTQIVSSGAPVWNQLMNFQINLKVPRVPTDIIEKIYQSSILTQEITSVQCQLYDNNAFGDDFLGDFELDCFELLEKPNIWVIDKEFQLQNMTGRQTKGTITGTVKLKVGFVPDGGDVKKLAL